MSFNFLREVINSSKQSTKKDKFVEELSALVGKDSATRIVEAYQVSPVDYTTWLDVVKGYAQTEGINISRRTDFIDVAMAVLENDPAPIDEDMKEAIVDKLWVDYKAGKKHSRVERLARAKEEEEQLNFAKQRLQNRSFDSDGEQEEISDWSIDFEDEEEFDRSLEDDQINSDDEFSSPEENDDEFDDSYYQSDEVKTPVQDDDREEWDFSSEEGMKRKEKYEPTEYYNGGVEVQDEEHSSYDSPFRKGQLVKCKKDGQIYTVEVPDARGDQIGLLVNNRIKLVSSKDLEAVSTEDEEEKKVPAKMSFLHDVLTGTHTKEHLSKLQKQVEDEGANAWTTHHAKAPKNPHPKGSIAYKSWEKGFKQAAMSVWAPKVNKDSAPKKKTSKK